jgi:Soluble lytic murein transglycosylase and related regulatory proteins (some contain LysM/invasin domains)
MSYNRSNIGRSFESLWGADDVTTKRRAATVPTIAIVFGIALLGVTSPVLAKGPAYAHADEPSEDPGTISALSPADRLTYTNAFDALRRGDLDRARATAREANDRILLGEVEFQRLFHPDHTATYDELVAWLADYSDLPNAQRAYTLALRRMPDGATPPPRPSGISSRLWDRVAIAGGNSEADPLRAARVAYNNDDMITAARLGAELGDWWTVGLAQWRLRQFEEARLAFARVLDDPTRDGWDRAGAALWASRAAHASGRLDQVQPYLRQATHWPATFYGQIALAQLGQEPVIENAGAQPYDARLTRTRYAGPEADRITQAEIAAFVRSDVRARRVVAYAEIGRRTDAVDELRAGLREATNDASRMLWGALGRALGSRISGNQSSAERIDANDYPMPVLQPEGGFTTEPSLVYAIARKESNFNARARSGAGAYGLMQVMPTTAAQLSGDRGFVSSPNRLFDPGVNARLGQAYVNRVLTLPAINGDLLRMAASYNAGPGPMVDAVRKLGPDADPLLLIETIDVPQARDYVEKVVAAYWIYQRLMGRPLNTLQAVASGASAVPLSLDYVPPPPPPLQPATGELQSAATDPAGSTPHPVGVETQFTPYRPVGMEVRQEPVAVSAPATGPTQARTYESVVRESQSTGSSTTAPRTPAAAERRTTTSSGRPDTPGNLTSRLNRE